MLMRMVRARMMRADDRFVNGLIATLVNPPIRRRGTTGASSRPERTLGQRTRNPRNWALRSSSALWPVQVFVQKLEGALAIDGVAAVEEFDLGFVPKSELIVKPPRLREFRRDPRIEADAIVMPALDHERAGEDEVAQLRVAEGRAHVEARDFPFVTEH